MSTDTTVTTPTATAGTEATGTEELLVEIFREVLGASELDADADFYEAGGDSLTAFQITGRFQDERNIEVPVSLVFAYPTPRELAEVIDTDF
ncbi:acyl carrier protein [Streptomyces sp. P38-E01]|uniref:Acyl carrier protein n=1 Tax=Streptomyces tardus TaxID=2780544 RepID=A0A949JN09_9ACTN|nr:acyl carrier protein [Streptomyces tardus]MBU7597115.1 acyl carrier protein [Streptomyces tardus]